MIGFLIFYWCFCALIMLGMEDKNYTWLTILFCIFGFILVPILIGHILYKINKTM
jgi:hypothetical protein